jgi:hypothetical protein
MKKTLVSALTTALVVGAASTTFAAANPFSDVPADHWAYDAVAQLAADGVIDGYGDGTYRGDRNITRYEMAQMVAKAMAKSTSGADKALVDKLAAEFADELNNLGVRVAKLERNADVVKWTGKAEYTISRYNQANRANDEHKNNLLFRLEPTAEVNSNWHVKARLNANIDMAADAGNEGKAGKDGGRVSMDRIWAQGDYKNFQVKLGRFESYDSDNVFDTEHTGAEVSFGKDVKATIGYARVNKENFNRFTGGAWVTSRVHANHLYAGVDYAKDKLNVGVSFHNVKLHDAPAGTTPDSTNVYVLKAGYQFLPTLNANAWYAKGSENFSGLDQTKAAALEVNYKGAEAENKGSFGAWVAYRHLGRDADLLHAYDALRLGQKGFEIGANYTLFKNVVLTGRYGWGKTIEGGDKVSNAFGRVEFLF